MDLLNRVRVCRRSFKLSSGLSEGEGFRESGLGQRRKQEAVTVDERCHGAETILGIKRGAIGVAEELYDVDVSWYGWRDGTRCRILIEGCSLEQLPVYPPFFFPRCGSDRM